MHWVMISLTKTLMVTGWVASMYGWCIQWPPSHAAAPLSAMVLILASLAYLGLCQYLVEKLRVYPCPAPTLTAKGEQEWEVAEILDERDGKYLVRWEGYPLADATWEPAHHLLSASKVVLKWAVAKQVHADLTKIYRDASARGDHDIRNSMARLL